jgi:hypothetical protein
LTLQSAAQSMHSPSPRMDRTRKAPIFAKGFSFALGRSADFQKRFWRS